jgi:hypothetical protein
MWPKFATYFTFSEFNGGVRATPEQFRAELSRFNGPAVVYLCGVMNSVTLDWQGRPRAEAHEEFVRNTFAPQVAELINAAARDPLNPRGVYHRQQFLFVSKEALLHSQDQGGEDPLAPHLGGEFGRVLLMASDLLPKRITAAAPTRDQMINVLSEIIPIAEASGSYKAIHKIIRSRLMLDRFFPNDGAEIRQVFEKATGVPLNDYFALCFATLCRYFDLDLKKFQQDTGSFILSQNWFRTSPIAPSVIGCFLAEISATAQEFRVLLEKKRGPANDFTMFRSKPIFGSGEAHFLIDPLFLAEKIESGVFWRVHQALPDASRLQLHQDWGLAFEKYVNWLIGESIDGSLNRLYPNPKFSDTGEEVCDAILVCGDSALFIESKGATFTAEAKYGTDSNLLRDEIEEKLVETKGRRKGVGQLALRIEEVFRKKNPRGVEALDTSRVGKVFPVLVTRDDIGAALVMNAYLASRFRELFRRKSVSVTVTPPFSLSAQDLEMICGYLQGASLADLLEERYRNDRGLLSTFWFVENAILERMGDLECKPLNNALHSYFRSIAETLFPGMEIPSPAAP